MNRRRAPRSAALLMMSCLLATACGSTVQDAGSAGRQALPGGGSAGAVTDGLSLPASDDASAAASGGAGGQALNGSSRAGSSSSGAAGTTTLPDGSQGAGLSGASGVGGAPREAGGAGEKVPVGPGVTATSIALGIPYCNDCAAGNAALGAGSEDPGDTRRYYQAALDEVNARGGVLGRKLVPVFHEVSVNDSNLDAAGQASCETFTNDNKVLVMLNRGDVAYECAKKAGVLVLGPGVTGPTFEKFPNLFAPASVRLERLYAATVQSMVRAGWHKPDAKWPTGKIGLITWDDNDYVFAMKNGFLKALREAGLKETDVRYIAVPQSGNSIADASAAISSAVLRFQQQGIDHVFIGDGPAGVFLNAGLTLLFLQNAKSQNYFPRYALNTNNDPDFQSHPKDQLVGMLAIDASDSEPANDEGIAPNPVRERCFAVMRKKGLPVGGNQTRGHALSACGLTGFTEAILKRATGGTTLPMLISAAESLGTSYRAPSSYGNRLGPGRHDGAALFRELRFDEGCSCVKYTSKPFEP